MDMDPELVLQPELFLLGLQRGDEFDVSRVREQLRALLPPLSRAHVAALAALDKCADKPVYRLQKESGVVSEYSFLIFEVITSYMYRLGYTLCLYSFSLNVTPQTTCTIVFLLCTYSKSIPRWS